MVTKKVTEEIKMALDKPQYRNEVDLIVENVILELTGKNKEWLRRIRFVTKNEGEITYRPKKPLTETGTLGVFDTVHSKTELYGVDEFVKLNPFLEVLAKNCKDKPQKIVGGFSESFSIPEGDEEKVLYKFFRVWNLDEIYYKEFHKEDTSNLDKQKERSALV